MGNSFEFFHESSVYYFQKLSYQRTYARRLRLATVGTIIYYHHIHKLRKAIAG
jgi:hypothetical protein